MSQRQLEQVIRAIRAAFQDLKASANNLHRGSGVNASMRAVLEHLGERGAQTVPQIAREKNVSRQHIQGIVDALRDGDLVSLQDNPAHQRSPLVAMTSKGRNTWRHMREKERAFLRQLGRGLDPSQLGAAIAVIGQIRKQLTELEERDHGTLDTR